MARLPCFLRFRALTENLGRPRRQCSQVVSLTKSRSYHMHLAFSRVSFKTPLLGNKWFNATTVRIWCRSLTLCTHCVVLASTYSDTETTLSSSTEDTGRSWRQWIQRYLLAYHQHLLALTVGLDSITRYTQVWYREVHDHALCTVRYWWANPDVRWKLQCAHFKSRQMISSVSMIQATQPMNNGCV